MLALVISFPIAFMVVLILVIWFIRIKYNDIDQSIKGAHFFTFDISTRKINLNNRGLNKITNKYIFKEIEEGKWTPLTSLTNVFKGTAGAKEIRNGLLELEKNDSVAIEFETENVVKNTPVKFKFKIDKLESSKLYVLNFSWNGIKHDLTEKAKVRVITKDDIAMESDQHIGFLSFSLNNSYIDIEKKFSREFSKILKKDKISILTSNGVAIVPIWGKKRKIVEKKLAKWINLIKTKGYKRGINRLYKGSGQIFSSDINTPKRVNTIIKSMDYLVNLSIRLNEDFVSKDNPKFDAGEFKKFTEASQIFRLALRTRDISFNPISIQSYKSKKKIVNYIAPSMNNVSQKMLSIILKNKYNRSKLIDSQASKILIESKNDQPVLIDVNVEWLLENKNKIVYENAIYVLNFRSSTSAEFVDAIIKLQKEGFIFAIRFKVFNEQVSTLIANIKPQFIVIDETMTKITNPKSFVQLISLKAIADLAKTKLIYENPSLDISSRYANQIGLKYYYESK